VISWRERKPHPSLVGRVQEKENMMFPRNSYLLAAIRLAVLADIVAVVAADIFGPFTAGHPSVVWAALAGIAMPAGIWLIIEFMMCTRYMRQLGEEPFLKKALRVYFVSGLSVRFLAESLRKKKEGAVRREQEHLEAEQRETARRYRELVQRAEKLGAEVVQCVRASFQSGNLKEAERRITLAERDKPLLERADRLGVRDAVASLLGSDALDTAVEFMNRTERRRHLIEEAMKLDAEDLVRDSLGNDDEARALELIKSQKERLRRAAQLRALADRLAGLSDHVSDLSKARQLLASVAASLNGHRREFDQALYAAEKEVQAAEAKFQRARKRSSRPKTNSRETPTVD